MKNVIYLASGWEPPARCRLLPASPAPTVCSASLVCVAAVPVSHCTAGGEEGKGTMGRGGGGDEDNDENKNEVEEEVVAVITIGKMTL